MKKIITGISILIVLIVIFGLMFDWGRNDNTAMTDTVQTTTSGAVVSNNGPITVSYPTDNQTVTSPIHITGKVVGNWFFENSFPVMLVDDNSNIIGTGTAQTNDGNWMTTSSVGFFADISYVKSTSTNRGFLVLKKDNPSGDPAHDQEKFIPLILK